MIGIRKVALMTDITPRSPRWQMEFEGVFGFPFNDREAIGAYYACISFIDAQVGLILNALDTLELRKNTIVVFMSDHGFHLGDHGGLWAKLSLFERAVRVPFAIIPPRGRAGISRRIVELIDLYPTLIELCGLSRPRESKGAASFLFCRILERLGMKRPIQTRFMTAFSGSLSGPTSGATLSGPTDSV